MNLRSIEMIRTCALVAAVGLAAMGNPFRYGSVAIAGALHSPFVDPATILIDPVPVSSSLEASLEPATWQRRRRSWTKHART